MNEKQKDVLKMLAKHNPENLQHNAGSVAPVQQKPGFPCRNRDRNGWCFLSVLDDPSLCDCSEPCPKCGKEMIFYHTEEHGSVWAECSDIENCGHIICKDDNGASAAALLACVRELEGKLATARNAMEVNIKRLGKKLYRSQLHHCDYRIQCEGSVESLREALKKIGGKG